MQQIKIFVLLLVMAMGSIHLTACESTENDIPITIKEVPKEATTGDQTSLRRDLPSSPVQAEVSREIPLEFGDLDIDNNQFIDQKEVVNIPRLKQQWSKLDQNADGQIEKAEFSRFEPDIIEDTGRP
ncbi:MAG: hypothetical protein L0Y43_08340 [Methylococcaceae bacterium]|nr:hypothetical protein [Methylococcaceae bacterium]